jgi:hypothetical protein
MKPDHVYLYDYDISNFKSNIAVIPDGLTSEVLKIKKCVETNDTNAEYRIQTLEIKIKELEKSIVDTSIISNLMKTINENPMLKTEWERFLTFIKLAASPDKNNNK